MGSAVVKKREERERKVKRKKKAKRRGKMERRMKSLSVLVSYIMKGEKEGC